MADIYSRIYDLQSFGIVFEKNLLRVERWQNVGYTKRKQMTDERDTYCLGH